LHLIINEKGEILAFQLTPGNVADVSVAETLSRGVFGKLFGDKGYISAELAKRLLKQELELFTTIRSNMKQKLMKLTGRILLRKRAVVETVNDPLLKLWSRKKETVLNKKLLDEGNRKQIGEVGESQCAGQALRVPQHGVMVQPDHGDERVTHRITDEVGP